jgi:hypothetical protein
MSTARGLVEPEFWKSPIKLERIRPQISSFANFQMDGTYVATFSLITGPCFGIHEILGLHEIRQASLQVTRWTIGEDVLEDIITDF